MLDEEKIIKAILNGELAAFEKLYQHYSPLIYNLALSYTKNHEDAEEITQDVFVKVYVKLVDFKKSSTLKTWIYRITVNQSLNYIKKKNTRRGHLENTGKFKDIHFEHPGVLLENKEFSNILFQVIDILNENQKTAFILSYIDCLPRQEVADIMETSLKAVESLLMRAKKNLREELIKLYPNRRIF